jgi:hypothetical protein
LFFCHCSALSLVLTILKGKNANGVCVCGTAAC